MNKVRNAVLVAVAVFALPGCVSKLGTMDHLFPQGSSFFVEDAVLNVNAGQGTLQAKRIWCVGTNGFQIQTNGAAPAAVTVTTTPAVATPTVTTTTVTK